MRHRLLNDSRHGVWRALHSTLRRTAYLPLFAATLVMLPFNVDADYVTVQPADVTAKFHGSVTFNEASGAYTINATTVKGFDLLFRVNGTRPLTFRVTDDSRNNSLVFVRSTLNDSCFLGIDCAKRRASSSTPAPNSCEVYTWVSSEPTFIKSGITTNFTVSVIPTKIAVAAVGDKEADGASCLLLPEDTSGNAVVWHLTFFTEKVDDGREYFPLLIQVDSSITDIVENRRTKSGAWPTADNILYIVSPPFLPPWVFFTYVGLTALLLMTLAAINIWAIYRHCVKMRTEEKRNRIIEILEHEKEEIGKETKYYTTRVETEMDDEASKKDQITKIEGTRESTALPPLLRTEATRESTALPPRQSVTMSVKQ
ncbi:hypothetical protein AAVH_05059 [Aphelenchoides avenae]|nr:hypothetical protein AAVH_05059 [Aphelenchus avenae]